VRECLPYLPKELRYSAMAFLDLATRLTADVAIKACQEQTLEDTGKWHFRSFRHRARRMRPFAPRVFRDSANDAFPNRPVTHLSNQHQGIMDAGPSLKHFLGRGASPRWPLSSTTSSARYLETWGL
jgi:hypothetical protein